MIVAVHCLDTAPCWQHAALPCDHLLIIVQVRCEWGLSPGQESLLSSAVFAGTMVGANAWGAVSDSLGRKRGFTFTALFIFGFGLLSALAPNYWVHPSRRALLLIKACSSKKSGPRLVTHHACP